MSNRLRRFTDAAEAVGQILPIQECDICEIDMQQHIDNILNAISAEERINLLRTLFPPSRSSQSEEFIAFKDYDHDRLVKVLVRFILGEDIWENWHYEI